MRRVYFFLAPALLLAAGRWLLRRAPAYEPQEGDVVFQCLPDSPLHALISGVTKSPYSHCGIVSKQDGAWTVIESRGPVREIGLDDWIAQGGNRGFAAYRLRSKLRAAIPRWISAARTFLGRPYDFHYRFAEEAVYCSELVFKAFSKATGATLGRLRRLRDLDWQPYRAAIEALEAGRLPLDRLMITPEDLAAARQLELVHRVRI